MVTISLFSFGNSSVLGLCSFIAGFCTLFDKCNTGGKVIYYWLHLFFTVLSGLSFAIGIESPCPPKTTWKPCSLRISPHSLEVASLDAATPQITCAS